MSTSRRHRHKRVIGGSQSSVDRFLLALAICFVILFGLGWFLPHTLIILTLLVMVWYFVRSGEWTRFSPRTLCVLGAGMISILPSIILEREWTLGRGAAVLTLTFLTIIGYFVLTGERARFSLRTLFVIATGFAAITAIAIQVPCWALDGEPLWPGERVRPVPKQVVIIEVVDKTTQRAIPNAEVILTRNTSRISTTYQGKTKASGIAEFQCRCIVALRKSFFPLRTWTTYRTDGWSIEAISRGYDFATKTLSNVSVEGEGGNPLHFRIELEPETGKKG